MRNLEKSRADGRERTRRYMERLRAKALNKLGGKCSNCGIIDIRVLEIDHINGDGKTHRHLGSANYLRAIVKMPKTEARQHYQVLCANCHSIKTYENKEFANRN